jgi:hypothetical protein
VNSFTNKEFLPWLAKHGNVAKVRPGMIAVEPT